MKYDQNTIDAATALLKGDSDKHLQVENPAQLHQLLNNSKDMAQLAFSLLTSGDPGQTVRVNSTIRFDNKTYDLDQKQIMSLYDQSDKGQSLLGAQTGRDGWLQFQPNGSHHDVRPNSPSPTDTALPQYSVKTIKNSLDEYEYIIEIDPKTLSSDRDQAIAQINDITAQAYNQKPDGFKGDISIQLGRHTMMFSADDLDALSDMGNGLLGKDVYDGYLKNSRSESLKYSDAIVNKDLSGTTAHHNSPVILDNLAGQLTGDYWDVATSQNPDNAEPNVVVAISALSALGSKEQDHSQAMQYQSATAPRV